MKLSSPFKLTLADIRSADLEPSDIGSWCIKVDCCYHIFQSEALATIAYDKMVEGVFVR